MAAPFSPLFSVSKQSGSTPDAKAYEVGPSEEARPLRVMQAAAFYPAYLDSFTARGRACPSKALPDRPKNS